MIEWFIDNLYSNIFTIITVVISCAASYGISALYFHIGNRNNLKMTLIHPIKRIVKDEKISRENYKLIGAASKDYCSRYLHSGERKTINNLIEKYGKVTTYNEIRANADSLFSYFLYTLEKNKIETRVVPLVIEDETVDMELPSDLYYLTHDLELNLQQNYYDECNEESNITEIVSRLFEHYCKTNYTDRKIEYFKDHSFHDVLKKSENKAKWDKCFNEYEEAKKEFLAMTVAKD